MKPSELFNKTGYAIKYNVFSKEEIVNMRERVKQQLEEDQKNNLTFTLQNTSACYSRGDLLSKNHLNGILLDPRILQIAKDVLNTEHLVYFGDSTYQTGTGARGFHRDNVDRIFKSGPDWTPEYNLVRIGIYLQDHAKFSGGLKVKVGSHANRDGKTIFINSNAGDVAVWSLKTLHSGNAVRLKGLPGVSIDHSSIENRIPAFLKKEQQQERMSLFMTFGVPGPHVDRFIAEYMLKREDVLLNLKANVYSDDARKLLQSRNIELIEPLQVRV
jgi:Phytanoyl-CoA dioxygenase (PhyH)